MDSTGGRARRTGDVRKHRPDYGLVLISGLLVLIGLIIIYAISPGLSRLHGGNVGEDYYLTKQLIAIALGLAAFSFTALMPMSFWKKMAPWLIVGAGVSSLLLLIPGARFNDPINGATRWIQLGPLSFQPAELIKFAVMINVALWLTKQSEAGKINDMKETIKPYALGLLGVAIILMIAQKDMGSTMVVAAMMLAMIYIAGLKTHYLGMVAGAFLSTAVVASIVQPHRVARILTFLHPEQDALGQGYHISQALIAVGSGGVVGQGLGRSVQAFGYLPEAANDSIFAVVAEKFGFVGSVLLIALFGALLFKMISIIERTPDMFNRLVATSIMAWIASHILINIGAMLSLMPLKGITLPFISYGGSSLLFTMAALGVMLQISRFTVPKARMSSFNGGAHESTRLGGRNRRPRYADASRYR